MNSINNQYTRARNSCRRLKRNIRKYLHEDPVRTLSVIRYGIDCILCRFLYGATISDYFELHFYEKSPRLRKTYFTTKYARRFILQVNQPEANRCFCDKTSMYRTLGPLTKRQQLFCPPASFDEFQAFFQKYPTVFYKANRAYCGAGIKKWSIEKTDIQTLYKKSCARKAVLDAPIIQHPDISRLNPDCVSTIKVFTLMAGEECHFVAAEFRMGRKGKYVDNIERGGLAAIVDLDSGRLLEDAYDLQFNRYRVHPDTGEEITGFLIPHWKQVLLFTEICARACPLNYAEWDIAIGPEECCLVEVNPNARNSGIQMGRCGGRREQFRELEQLFLQSPPRSTAVPPSCLSEL